MKDARKVGKEGNISPAAPPVKTTIEVPGELWKELKIRAVREGKTLSCLVAEILREYVEGGK